MNYYNLKTLIKNNNKYAKSLNKKLHSLQRRIVDKCTNPNNKKYHVYGGRGVSYDQSWNDPETFVRDALSIDGFNTMEFLKGNLQLDKDFKDPEGKMYSKSLCNWLSNDDNEKVKPSRWKDYHAYCYDKDTLYNFNEITKAADSLGINRTAINRAIMRNSSESRKLTPTTTMGWIFWEGNNKPFGFKEYSASNIDGTIKVKSLTQSKVEKLLGIGGSKFHKMLKSGKSRCLYKDKFILEISNIDLDKPKYIVNF